MTKEIKITKEMKAACMGEFFVDAFDNCMFYDEPCSDKNCEECGGTGSIKYQIAVPWNTCKEIYKKMRKLEQ